MPPGKRAYRVEIPLDAQTTADSQVRRNVSSEGAVIGDTTVTPVSLDAGSNTVRAEFKGRNAMRKAREVEQLANAGGIEFVPVMGVSPSDPSVAESSGDDGYYTMEDASVTRQDARADNFPRVTVTLTRVGTEKSHTRSVSLALSQPQNDFGSTLEAPVGVPSSATKVRWYDRVDKVYEEATSTATRPAEHGDVDVYDATSSSYSGDRVSLIYEMPYVEEGRVDPSVWDDRGSAKTTTVDGDTSLEWQRVFRTDHGFDGSPVVENGLLRLTFDEANSSLSAEEWDDGAGSWSSLSLGTQSSSSWELLDYDATEIQMNVARAQVEFRDPSTLPTSYFRLNCALPRGYTDALWTVPDPSSQGATPQGLQELLNPIAAGYAYDPGGSQTLVRRRDVRK